MKNLIIFLMLALVVPTARGQKKVQQARLVSVPVMIDGISNEWKQPLNFSDKEHKFTYSVSNDEKNIYLCLQSVNPGIQQKITRSGISVQLNCSGKNKHKATIVYPLKSQLSSPNQTANRSGNRQSDPEALQGPRPTRTEMRQRQLDRCTSMKVKGLSSINGEVPLVNSCGVCVALKWEAEMLLTYEMTIPFTEFYDADFSESSLDLPIEVKITIAGIPQPSSGGTGGRSAGRGGRGGGRGGGAPPGGSMNQRNNDMFLSTIAKSSILLNKVN